MMSLSLSLIKILSKAKIKEMQFFAQLSDKIAFHVFCKFHIYAPSVITVNALIFILVIYYTHGIS